MPSSARPFSSSFDRFVWSVGVLGIVIAVFLTVAALQSVLWPLPPCVYTACPSKLEVDLRTIEAAAHEFAEDHGGRYPAGLIDLVTPDAEGWTYVEGTHVPRDPWCNEYLYEPPGPDCDRLRIWTLGSDGAPGGSGDGADVDNRTLFPDD